MTHQQEFHDHRLAHATLCVAFQGTRGAWSDLAIDRVWGVGTTRVAHRSFDGVVHAVATGLATYGILPVHNVISGPVTAARAALSASTVRIDGHVDVPIRHCLLGVPGASIHDIEVVYSHSVALQQCARFIDARKLKPVAHYNTAGAAQHIAHTRRRNEGAIASEVCATRYGLVVLSRHVSDHMNNITRFALLSRS